MPVSVFKDSGGLPETIGMSEVSGMQLNRQLVLASRLHPRPGPAVSLLQELVQAEFARLEAAGAFRFSAQA
jgi:LysR family transcriptional regulator, nitrogen assimilation regulatory protein